MSPIFADVDPVNKQKNAAINHLPHSKDFIVAKNVFNISKFDKVDIITFYTFIISKLTSISQNVNCISQNVK